MVTPHATYGHILLRHVTYENIIIFNFDRVKTEPEEIWNKSSRVMRLVWNNRHNKLCLLYACLVASASKEYIYIN